MSIIVYLYKVIHIKVSIVIVYHSVLYTTGLNFTTVAVWIGRITRECSYNLTVLYVCAGKRFEDKDQCVGVKRTLDIEHLTFNIVWDLYLIP